MCKKKDITNLVTPLNNMNLETIKDNNNNEIILLNGEKADINNFNHNKELKNLDILFKKIENDN